MHFELHSNSVATERKEEGEGLAPITTRLLVDRGRLCIGGSPSCPSNLPVQSPIRAQLEKNSERLLF